MKMGSKLLLGMASVGAAVVALDVYARNNPAEMEDMKDTVRKNAAKTKEKTMELTEDIRGRMEPIALKSREYLQEQTGKLKDTLLAHSSKNKENDAIDEEDLELELLEDIVHLLEEKDLKDAKMIVIKAVDSNEEDGNPTVDDKKYDELSEEVKQRIREKYGCKKHPERDDSEVKVKMPFTMRQWSEMDEETKYKICYAVQNILE